MSQQFSIGYPGGWICVIEEPGASDRCRHIVEMGQLFGVRQVGIDRVPALMFHRLRLASRAPAAAFQRSTSVIRPGTGSSRAVTWSWWLQAAICPRRCSWRRRAPFSSDPVVISA